MEGLIFGIVRYLYSLTFLSNSRQPEVVFFSHFWTVVCPNVWTNRLYSSQDTKKYKFGSVKGAVSRQSSSFCLTLPITRRQSLWNLK